MNCELCGKSPARIRYTEVRQGEAHQRRICEQCARSLGFGVPEVPEGGSGAAAPPPEVPSAKKKSAEALGLAGAGSTPAASAREMDGLRCPACGVTAGELRSRSLLGCPKCYETFGALLDELLRKVHGAVAHRGRLPGGRVAEAMDEETLRRKLEEAIAQEDFGEAARLRDRLRRAGGVPPDTPGEEAL